MVQDYEGKKVNLQWTILIFSQVLQSMPTLIEPKRHLKKNNHIDIFKMLGTTDQPYFLSQNLPTPLEEENIER